MIDTSSAVIELDAVSKLHPGRPLLVAGDVVVDPARRAAFRNLLERAWDDQTDPA